MPRPLYVPPAMAGKTVLVTGGTGGIGLAAAKAFAVAGATVLITTRSVERGNAAIGKIVAAAGHERAWAYRCDFVELECVRRVAVEVMADHPRLDVLVNNAGAILSERRATIDGFEETWQVDHLAAFLLTNVLRPALLAAAPSRVVTVSSDAHLRTIRGIRFDDVGLSRGWSPFAAYSQAKLANIMFAYELARRWKPDGIASNSVHPGAVRSGFGAGGWGFSGVAWRAISAFHLTPEQGADTVVWTAAAPELEGVTGQYFYRRAPKKSSRASYDEPAQRRLWDLSATSVGLASPGTIRA